MNTSEGLQLIHIHLIFGGNNMWEIILGTATVTAATESDSNPAGFIAPAIAIAIAIAIMRWFFTRRNSESVAAASAETVAAGGPPPITAIVAPAPPLATSVATVRELLGDEPAEPRITRYTRPVLAVSADGIALSTKADGTILSVPIEHILSVVSAPAKLKPHGTPIAGTYPALHVTIKKGDSEATIVFAPIVGAYDKVTATQAAVLAAQINERLGQATA